ncbi:MAG: vitamin B12-dependent ribonucleotide reductase [Bacillota bacterium]|nr:vitamin B12-dependent ribonucleotide reductase [Bacillota bacterium]
MAELGFSENALVVLRKRYLAKDEQGKVVETPAQLFRRVARNISLVEGLYLPDAYDPAGTQAPHAEPAPDAQARPERVGAVEGLTRWDWEMLQRAYIWLDAHGHMRVSFDELVRVMERESTRIRSFQDELYQAMTEKQFMFNSPTLMNAGRELSQLSACFVLPVEDSLAGIFESIKHAALIHQSGGGTGMSFSRLRPKNDVVRTTGGVASGPVSFMRVFNAATEAIKQGGTRRGANMGILRVDHPDILEFITSKQDNADITNFNISVGITEEFMRGVKEDAEYDLINPRTGKAVGRLRARQVFDRIVEGAWRNGEPGIVFLDRLNRDNPTPELGEIESTNPCGEQPLLPHEACCLGSINLSQVVRPDCDSSGGPGPGLAHAREAIDWEELARLSRLGVRCLDNIIDANRYPLPEIEVMAHGNRKIGLGVMGWADMLIKLGISYHSEEALRLADEVMGFIRGQALEATRELAGERGAFPNFGRSVFRDGPPVRNATLTTIAPTGTVSIIAGCSSGIEPLFALAFFRKVLEGRQLVEVNPLFEEVAQREGFRTPELMRVVAERGSVRGLPEVPERWQRVFVTALEVDPEWHIRMQAAFQAHTDNAVSKTVNMPNQATCEDVAKVYFLAYELGCKGVTIYRDRSREEQVLNVGALKKRAVPGPAGEEGRREGVAGPAGSAGGGPSVGESASAGAGEPPVAEGGGAGPRVAAAATAGGPNGITPRARPAVTRGATERIKTGCGNLYVTINEDDYGLCEVFASMGKSGGCAASQSEAVARLISLALRSGVRPESIVKELRGIRCPSPAWLEGGGMVLSCPDAIGIVLERYLKRKAAGREAAARASAGGEASAREDGAREDAAAEDVPGGVGGGNPGPSDAVAVTLDPVDNHMGACPECGGHLTHESGCLVCHFCGYSRCG